MFKPHYGTCTHPEHKFGDESFIVVKKGWCQHCNHAEKQKNKKVKAKGYVRKVTGEAELFAEILAEYDDPMGENSAIIRCWVCGSRISHPRPHNFAHILSKGSSPKLRLYKPNVRIMCWNIEGTGCHTKWDTVAHSDLKDPMWDKVKKLRDELKEFEKDYNP